MFIYYVAWDQGIGLGKRQITACSAGWIGAVRLFFSFFFSIRAPLQYEAVPSKEWIPDSSVDSGTLIPDSKALDSRYHSKILLYSEFNK